MVRYSVQLALCRRIGANPVQRHICIADLGSKAYSGAVRITQLTMIHTRPKAARILSGHQWKGERFAALLRFLPGRRYQRRSL